MNTFSFLSTPTPFIFSIRLYEIHSSSRVSATASCTITAARHSPCNLHYFSPTTPFPCNSKRGVVSQLTHQYQTKTVYSTTTVQCTHQSRKRLDVVSSQRENPQMLCIKTLNSISQTQYLHAGHILSPFRFVIFSIAFVDSDNFLWQTALWHTFPQSCSSDCVCSHSQMPNVLRDASILSIGGYWLKSFISVASPDFCPVFSD